MKHFTPLWCITAIFISACATSKPTVVASKPNISPKPVHKSTNLTFAEQQNHYDSLPLQYARDVTWNLIQSNIDIHFNLDSNTADATEKLILHPHFYPQDSVVLDAVSMKIYAVKDRKGNHLPFDYNNRFLKIKLPQQFTPKDTIELNIVYLAQPDLYESAGSSAITEDKGLYFINTNHKEPYKPVQIWTQGETQANSHWFPTFDNPQYRSAFKITMHVPDSFKTLSNGFLIHSFKEKNQMRADVWEQKTPIPTYLAMMAAGNYFVYEDTKWKGKAINYYVPQNYKQYAAGIFARTPQMVDFFSEKLGVPYPWDKYSQIIAYDYVSGAMENVSASLFGAFNLKNNKELYDDNNDFIVAHELFHQWFGDYATTRSWSDITLNESFADFSEILWAEHSLGIEGKEETWLNGMNRYLLQAQKNDAPLVRNRYESQEDVFDRISYSKGGRTLQYLRSMLGDDAFFSSLKYYLKTNALQSTDPEDLRRSFEKVTGQDLSWFWAQWYYRGGHPDLQIIENIDSIAKKVKLTIRQVQPNLYTLPTKILVIDNGQQKITDFVISDTINTISFNYTNNVPTIIFDPYHNLVSEKAYSRNATQWQAQFEQYNDFLSRREATRYLAESAKSDSDLIHIYTQALSTPSNALTKYTMDIMVDGFAEKYDTIFAPIFTKIAKDNHYGGRTRSLAINTLRLSKDKNNKWTYLGLLNDTSNVVSASALAAVWQLDSTLANFTAKKCLASDQPSGSLLDTAANIIATNGDASDWPYFKDKIWHLFERQRSSFVTPYMTYLNHISDTTIFKNGLENLIALATTAQNPSTVSSAGMAIALLTSEYKDKEDALPKAKYRIAQTAWEDYKSKLPAKNKKLQQSIKDTEEDLDL